MGGTMVLPLFRTTSIFLAFWAMSVYGQSYDIVISRARVVDPESKTDSVRDVGITGSRITGLSAKPLSGKRVIDGRGLVLAPGFIDLHWHGVDPASDAYELHDGVTTSLELEIGVKDIDAYYKAREGKSLIHHGAAAGHAPVRMEVLGDSGDFLPADKASFGRATEEDVAKMKMRLEQEFKQGAVALGLGIVYTQGASYWEIIEMFKLAARFNAVCHVHLRGASSAVSAENGRIQGLSEVIAAAAVTGASLHVVHINSSSQASITRMMEMIEGARKAGIDVTTEAYPYTAGATRIESAVFDGVESRPDSYFSNMQWVKTGERLTRETFLKYRKERGLVITHSNTEENVRKAITHPLVMIASDGFDVTSGGHPRSAGTFTKILRQYVRDEKAIPLMDAIAKMTIMPARRLEKRVPAMKNKGRIKVGADADLVLFDPATVRDRATYEKPDAFSEGMKVAIVNGVVTLADGKVVEGVHPGKGIRAAVVADK
jgi:N-acyl-D-aspartate/D-glutamate deacylase